MTESLDHWLATECMGYTQHYEIIRYTGTKRYYWLTKDNHKIYGWHPTDPKTGQIWLCVEKITQTKDILIGSKRSIWFCEIREKTYPVPMNGFYQEDPNPCLAIAKAIEAALKEEG